MFMVLFNRFHMEYFLMYWSEDTRKVTNGLVSDHGMPTERRVRLVMQAIQEADRVMQVLQILGDGWELIDAFNGKLQSELDRMVTTAPPKNATPPLQ